MKYISGKEIKVNLTDKTKRRIHLVCGIVLSALLVLTGVLFITSCYRIYESGYQPFTRASISAAFAKISVPVYITLAAVVGGVVLGVVIPTDKARLRGVRSDAVNVSRLAGRVEYDALAPDMREGIDKERRLRRVLTLVNIVLFVLEGILPLIYLLNPNNFPAVSGEYNTEILHGMLVYTACLSPLLAYEVAYVIVTDRSYRREAELLKEAIRLHGISTSEPKESSDAIGKIKAFFKANERPITLGVRIAFVGCGALFIVLGILNGGMADVLIKAINICTECIGLG